MQLDIKEAALVYGRKEYCKSRNPRKDRREKKAESEKCHVTPKEEGCQRLTDQSQSCGDTKNNKNGLF